MMLLLSIWFIVSYLFGIVFVEPLNQFHLGGFPLGFWFAQQGSMYVFIILIFLYAHLMDRVDRRYGIISKSSPDSSHHSSESTE